MSMEAHELTGESVWTAALEQQPERWLYPLSDSLAEEIEDAMQRVRSEGLSLSELTREDFRLPSWERDLGHFEAALGDGLGFGLIRGLPADRYTADELEAVFWLVGIQMGVPMAQNPAGDLIGHVRDHGQSFAMGRVRGYRTKESLTFHSDYADVVGLLCVQTAKSGGASTLVSSHAVYNEVMRRDIDLGRVLQEQFYFDRQGEESEGEDPFHQCPIFAWEAGKLSAHYSKRQIENAQVHSKVPEMTERQRAALELMDEVLTSEGLILHMEFERGDIQFLNNYTVLHSRTAFEDHEETERKRHLLRLWLTMDQRWPLDTSFTNAARFANLEWERATPRGLSDELLEELKVLA